MTKTRVTEIAAIVKDMEPVKIDVSWLKKPVVEMTEAVEYFGQYEATKMKREECERDLKVGKGEMEEMTAELGKREKDTRKGNSYRGKARTARDERFETKQESGAVLV